MAKQFDYFQCGHGHCANAVACVEVCLCENSGHSEVGLLGQKTDASVVGTDFVKFLSIEVSTCVILK